MEGIVAVKFPPVVVAAKSWAVRIGMAESRDDDVGLYTTKSLASVLLSAPPAEFQTASVRSSVTTSVAVFTVIVIPAAE